MEKGVHAHRAPTLAGCTNLSSGVRGVVISPRFREPGLREVSGCVFLDAKASSL